MGMRSAATGISILMLSTISSSSLAEQMLADVGAPVETGGGATSGHPLTEVDARLPELIANWLSQNFELPAIDDPPRIVFASADTMAILRRSSATTRNWSGMTANTFAIYVDADRTIYLPEGWTGSSPAELSVLVHEMVHHLQNQASMTFACTEEREKLAYGAQQAWLAMFGRNLSSEFEIDPFTVLARSLCPA